MAISNGKTTSSFYYNGPLTIVVYVLMLRSAFNFKEQGHVNNWIISLQLLSISSLYR